MEADGTVCYCLKMTSVANLSFKHAFMCKGSVELSEIERALEHVGKSCHVLLLISRQKIGMHVNRTFISNHRFKCSTFLGSREGNTPQDVVHR